MIYNYRKLILSFAIFLMQGFVHAAAGLPEQKKYLKKNETLPLFASRRINGGIMVAESALPFYWMQKAGVDSEGYVNLYASTGNAGSNADVAQFRHDNKNENFIPYNKRVRLFPLLCIPLAFTSCEITHCLRIAKQSNKTEEKIMNGAVAAGLSIAVGQIVFNAPLLLSGVSLPASWLAAGRRFFYAWQAQSEGDYKKALGGAAIGVMICAAGLFPLFLTK